MIKIVLRIYRRYIPKTVQYWIFWVIKGHFFRQLFDAMHFKYIYVMCRFMPDTEQNRLFALMGRYGVPFVPSQNYKKREIECKMDKQCGLYYVVHNAKKLYFLKIYTRAEAISCYRNLLSEQDDNSPHQYLRDTTRLRGKTILDIGAAEGLFALDAVEIAEHIYIFECDDRWLDPLKQTFSPWGDKVTIVRKYVSDINDESNITLDKFLEGKRSSGLFLKMDIEGYEQSALNGATNTFANNADIDFSICTYHKKDDAVEIAKFLENYSIEYEQTDGYMFFEKDLRRAIIRRKF